MEKKIKSILIPIGIILVFSFYISDKFSFYHENQYRNLESETQFNVKNSTSWNFTPLIIDDTGGSGNYTWSEAVAFDWCSGSGTSNDPYIIENIYISGQTSTFAIEIRNSTVYFIIRDCIIHYPIDPVYSNGIKLTNCTHGVLFNNTCEFLNKGILGKL